MYENNTITGLSRIIRKKEAKPSEICVDFLARAENSKSFITLLPDAVMKRAKELDYETITPETSPVFGIPIAVKDNICTKDMPTTCASKMLENFIPTYDATVVSRLRKQGAIIMGKTSMSEFDMGSANFDGSSDAAAEGSVLAGLSSDYGGLIRLSAFSKELIGYKPSHGAVSRFGLIANSGALEQIGPVCRTVSDVALLTAAVAGHDANDSITNADFNADFSGIETFNISGKKIGILHDNDTVTSAAEIYKSLGAEIVNISIPNLEHSLPVFNAIFYAESSSALSKLDGVRFGHRASNYTDTDSMYINSRTEGFGDEVKKSIIIGTYLLSAGNYERYHKKALILKSMICGDFTNAFNKCDIIMTPVTHKYAIPANITGLPAISLPVGVQLIGQKFNDADLLGFARALERETNGGKA